MQSDLERFLLYGSVLPLPKRVPLRAGPLTAVYEGGSLRYVRLGDQDVLLMIYAAVRDQNWGTVPGVLSDEQVNAGEDSFRISYRSDHRQGEIAFSWRGTITGQSDGTIVFGFDGQAESTFRRNRIGFCVLHPLNCGGQACEVEHVTGDIEESHFPSLISPHQPFKAIRALAHPLLPGLKARVAFEGDVFEMEDQRNWTDASFKTYCTPLELPFPTTVRAGERICQSVKLELLGESRLAAAGPQHTPVQIRFDANEGLPLPAIGLCATPEQAALSPIDIARLGALRLSHLRADLRFEHADSWKRLGRAAAQAGALSVPLELAVHFTRDIENELATLAEWARSARPPLSRWLVFRQAEKSTSAETVRLARKCLEPFGVPLGGGTDAFFAELNRARSPVEALDFVTYSINPQVHAFDHASLVETLAAQSETVRSAREFSAGRPVHVGPVTFKMRWNPNATAAEAAPTPGQLPAQVDGREMSLFGAGWTMGSIKALAEAGAASLTYFGLTGWLGVMERAEGCPLPALFPSIPEGTYPLYHVFADVGEFAGGQVIGTVSGDRLRVESLLLRAGRRHRLLLANFTSAAQEVFLPDLRRPARGRVLDGVSVAEAMKAPEVFRSGLGANYDSSPKGLSLRLAPFGYVRLDWEIS